MRTLLPSTVALICLALTGCVTATVDITKTSKGFYDPTVADDLEILLTKPDRPFIELGTVTASNFEVQNSAIMHNAIRAKAAALGANAVIITNEGIVVKQGAFAEQEVRYATGVAIRYK